MSKSKYREAAEKLFTEWPCCCCWALKVCGAGPERFTEFFYDPGSEHFVKTSDSTNPRHTLWFGDTDSQENQLTRSLALLFMEQLEKDGQL